MKKTLYFFSLLLSLFTLSCEKEDFSNTDAAEEERFGTPFAASQQLYLNTWNAVLDQAVLEPALGGIQDSEALELRSDCPEKTLTPADLDSYPKTLVLDYGTGCTSKTGASVSGTITAVFSGPMSEPGTQISITLSDLNWNGWKLTGNYSAIVTARGSYSVTVQNGSLTRPTGEVFTYSGSLEVKQIAGLETTVEEIGEDALADDVYQISLSLSGIDAAGKSYTANSLNPLVKPNSCEWVVSGTVEVKITGQPKKTLDFGSGSCDNQATLKTGPLTVSVTLP